VVRRHHLQPSWNLHGLQQGRNDTQHVADAHRHAHRDANRPAHHDGARSNPNGDYRSADDRGASTNYDDFGSAHHDRARTYAVNNSAAGPEWIVAERSSCEDLRQHVCVERTRNRPCWRHHRSRW
jgi:hypothetical protein